MTNEELKKYSIKTELTNYEMDLIEKLVYGEETNKSRKKSKTKH